MRRKKIPQLELVGVQANIFFVWCDGLTPGKTYKLVGSVSDAHGSPKDLITQVITTFEPECEQQLVQLAFPKAAAGWNESLRLILALHDDEQMLVTCYFERKVDLNHGWRPIMRSRYASYGMPRRFWIKLGCYIAVVVSLVVVSILFWHLSKGAATEELAIAYGRRRDTCAGLGIIVAAITAMNVYIDLNDPWARM